MKVVGILMIFNKSSITSYLLFFLIALIVYSFIVYGTSINGPFIFDDITKIVYNADIKDTGSILSNLFYKYGKSRVFNHNDPSRPLVYLSYSFNYHFSLLNPGPYRITNIILHILNALLLFVLLYYLLTPLTDKVFIISSISCLLFFVAPVNTDNVLYIYNRSDLLMTFFSLICLLFFIGGRRRPIFFIFSFLFFTFALLSKQSAVILPVIFILIDYFFYNSRSSRALVYSFFAFILVFLYLFWRFHFLGTLGDTEGGSGVWQWQPYITVMPFVFITYLKLLITGIGLSFLHLIPAMPFSDPRIIVSFLLVIISSFVVVLFYRRNLSLIYFFFGVFILSLLPTSSFFATTAPAVENRLYFGSLFFYAGLSYIIVCYLSRYHYFRYLLLFYIAIFIVISFQRAQLFANPLSLWKDVATNYRASFVPYYEAGYLYFERGDYKNALSFYNYAYSLSPGSPKVSNGLGLVFHCMGDYDNAIKYYKLTIEREPSSYNAYQNIADVYFQKGDYSNSAKALLYIINNYPRNSNTDISIIINTYCALSDIYYFQKQYTLSIYYLNLALSLDVNNTNILNKLLTVENIVSKYHKSFP